MPVRAEICDHARGMGISYFACDYEAEMTAAALADPRSILSGAAYGCDCGFVPGVPESPRHREGALRKQAILDLDKAWRDLRSLTAPQRGEETRPAHRMFEGDVRMCGYGWHSWERALTPDEMPVIAQDLMRLGVADVFDHFARSGLRYADSGEPRWVSDYLEKAQRFAETLAGEGRGMVYTIG